MYIEKNHYLINQGTYALVASYNEIYQTIIYDQKGTFYSQKRKIDILNEACMHYRMCNYDGSVKAMRKIFGYNKTPVMIGKHGIIATPTKSAKSYDCQFIFLANVLFYEKTPDGLFVEFPNHTRLKLNCSEYTFLEQCKRTTNCANYYYFGLTYIPPKQNKKNI
ncbi:hypothetical protein BpJC7_16980 [Weizmannia acidilactici]|uniref:Competence transcription factor n=1 Tax=Weizmannia acidilactici TaxID=2607726 RepID=A0A5J4JI82_9BACI|nr:competence protein ComK [Weizmannia acidilactici]GER67971.1 hypothetical protein BpJC4_24420 [Weizmannia acidilactici]GER70395.1 hypothetical protein BpJC7_16980 [Weizmannia acidilactici]GER74429.1 hypothetical protein BpPP18_24960 [Weizmannia acidilactici]